MRPEMARAHNTIEEPTAEELYLPLPSFNKRKRGGSALPDEQHESPEVPQSPRSKKQKTASRSPDLDHETMAESPQDGKKVYTPEEVRAFLDGVENLNDWSSEQVPSKQLELIKWSDVEGIRMTECAVKWVKMGYIKKPTISDTALYKSYDKYGQIFYKEKGIDWVSREARRKYRQANNAVADETAATPAPPIILMPPSASPTTVIVGTKRKAADLESTPQTSSTATAANRPVNNSAKRQKKADKNAIGATKSSANAAKTPHLNGEVIHAPQSDYLDGIMEDAPTNELSNTPKTKTRNPKKRTTAGLEDDMGPETAAVSTKKGSKQPIKRTAGDDGGANSAGAPLNTPLIPPGTIAKVFSPVPPPTTTPWSYDFAAPTPTYDQKIACPIDWSAIADPKCKPDAIQAYELRAPWNDSPPPFKDIAETIGLSQEGARKRFKKANLAVFEATGVYFSSNSLGLDGYGIPDKAELNDLLADMKRNLKEVLRSEAASARKKLEKALSYNGRPFSLAVHPPGRNGAVRRLITEEVMRQLRITDQHTVYCSAATFDRWYSCICMGLRHTFPRRVYRLEPLLDSYTHTDFGTPPTTVGDYFETYWLSQRMGTTAVSDMILDELIRLLRDEEELLAKYRSGKLSVHDNVDVVRFMNFDPEDINLLWTKTKTSDPIRDLVLSILSHKGQAAEEKIEEEKEEFDPDFIRAWNAHKVAQSEYPINDFVSGKNLNAFCARYHNHSEDDDCFRSKPEPSSVIPDDVGLCQTKAPPPKIIKLSINGVAGFAVQNRTGIPHYDERDLARLHRQTPSWEWERVRSITRYTPGPNDGHTTCAIRPVYYDPRTADANNRYPSHPGYRKPHWTPLPNASDHEEEGSNNASNEDAYEKPWKAVVKDDIPEGAQKMREDENTGDVVFEIEDALWYPPADWEPGEKKRPGQAHGEFMEYRKWLWGRRGGKVPRVVVKRFRPHERGFPAWRDCLRDGDSAIGSAGWGTV